MEGKTNFVRRVEGDQLKICSGSGGVLKLVMFWGWRGYFSACSEKFSRANGVLRVEGLENKICPEDGGGIEINMS